MLVLISIILLTGLAGFLAWYLLTKDKGEREPAGALWAALGFGALGLIPAGVLESFLPLDNLTKHAVALLPVLLSALAVGVIEEASKFVPLALFIYKKRYFNEYTDGILYFALAGIGFGLPENILYSLSFGGGVGLARVVITPFFHAATTAFIGYYLVRAKLSGKKMPSIWPVLVAVMGVHGLYDFGLLSGVTWFVLFSLLIAVGLTVTLFVLASVAKGRDQAVGLSVVGMNTFCRSCGHANPKHMLYCQACGRRA